MLAEPVLGLVDGIFSPASGSARGGAAFYGVRVVRVRRVIYRRKAGGNLLSLQVTDYLGVLAPLVCQSFGISRQFLYCLFGRFSRLPAFLCVRKKYSRFALAFSLFDLCSSGCRYDRKARGCPPVVGAASRSFQFVFVGKSAVRLIVA